MKYIIKRILQKLFGIHTYLLIFAFFVILKLRWDKNEKDFISFLKLIPDDGIIIDIGANIGVMTWYFAKRKRKAEIISFEPVPFNFKILNKIIRVFRLKNVTTYKFAVGEKEDTINMIVPKVGSVIMHGLCHIDETNKEINQNGTRISVNMITLNDFIKSKETKKRITAIKMDVENYENNVLMGADQIIQKNRPYIYTELWKNENREKCISFMEKLNYKTYFYNNHNLTLYNNYSGAGQNFVFLPAECELNIKA